MKEKKQNKKKHSKRNQKTIETCINLRDFYEIDNK